MKHHLHGAVLFPVRSLILADHTSVFKLFRPVRDIQHYHSDTHVVIDGGISFATDWLRIKTIPIRPRSLVKNATTFYTRRSFAIQRLVGDLFNMYEDSVPIKDFPNVVTDHLEEHLVILFPYASSVPQAEWQPGLGRITHTLTDRSAKVSLALFNIPRDSSASRFTGIFSLSEVSHNISPKSLNPRDLSITLQVILENQKK